jgi:hypothetical protein
VHKKDNPTIDPAAGSGGSLDPPNDQTIDLAKPRHAD